MQIDFHHGVTYVAARLAGFKAAEAEVIAYSSQYVDNATNEGEVRFQNQAKYVRIASAHEMMDYRNFDELATSRVWLPFHFLPGNKGEKATAKKSAYSENEFIERLVCLPNSHVAQDMVRSAILDQHRPYALHRLGITMHIYVDTWAHQGFCGIAHDINRASLLKKADDTGDVGMVAKLASFFSDKFDAQAGEFVSGVLPVGHGAVLSYPDHPFRVWSYVNGLGVRVLRDNPRDFSEAVREMFYALRRFIKGDMDADVTGDLPQKHFETIDKMLRDIRENDGELRHQRWLRAISDGTFEFKDNVRYLPKGEGSWKWMALGTEQKTDTGQEVYEYSPDFLSSNWKLFHDALQVHRLFILHDLLPHYGLVAA